MSGDPNFYRGAPMGTPSSPGTPEPVRFALYKWRLDSGGYDTNGCYWGLRRRGESLYRYSDEHDDASGYVDGFTRDEAKAKVRARFPNATFYR